MHLIQYDTRVLSSTASVILPLLFLFECNALLFLSRPSEIHMTYWFGIYLRSNQQGRGICTYQYHLHNFHHSNKGWIHTRRYLFNRIESRPTCFTSISINCPWFGVFMVLCLKCPRSSPIWIGLSGIYSHRHTWYATVWVI